MNTNIDTDPISILRTKYKIKFDRIIDLDTGEKYTSLCQAVQDVSSLDMTHEQYLDAITELRGQKIRIGDWPDYHMARYVFRYFVSGLVSNYKEHVVEYPELTYKHAVKLAKDYLAKEGWVNSTGTSKTNSEPRLDSAGNVAPPKGSKKVKAKEIYLAKIEGKGMSRKQAIELLCVEVSLTPPGASTYLANFKSGLW